MGNYNECYFWIVMWKAEIVKHYIENFVCHVKMLDAILG